MKNDAEKIGKLELHIGTERVNPRKVSPEHEASVLKQLKVIIEKNQQLIQQNRGTYGVHCH
jgi:hypothetical protein